MKNIYTEDTQLLKRVSENISGDGLRETWVEEGMDTGYCTIPTELVDRVITYENGQEVGTEEFVSHNLIVIGFGYLVASLLKGDATFGFPLQYWGIGPGEGSFWDALSVTARQAKSIFALTQLYDETFRKPVTIIFIDNNSDPVAPGPTNRIEAQATFGVDVIGEFREFGLFGGDASTTLDTGLMIDHKSHTVINMNNTPGQQNVLIRALRLTL